VHENACFKLLGRLRGLSPKRLPPCQDLKNKQLGLLNYIRREFLRKEVPETLPDISEDVRVWFLFFSRHNNTMQEEEIVRALIKSYGTAQDKDWQERVREVVSSIWAVLGPGEGKAIDLETFLAPDGVGESIVASVQNFEKELSASSAVWASLPAQEEPPTVALGREESLPPPVLLARETSMGLPLALPRSTSGLSKEAVADTVTAMLAASEKGPDAIRHILGPMRNAADSDKIQLVGCQALRQLMTTTEAAEALKGGEKVAAEGGLAVLLKAMKMHERHWLVQQEGCWALTLLVQMQPGVAKAAIDGGAVGEVMAAVQNHPSNAMVAARAFGALAALAASADDNGAKVGDLICGETNGVDSILKRMNSNVFNVPLQREGVRALYHISKSAKVMEEVKTAREAAKTVVLAMNDHWEADLHLACSLLLERWTPFLPDALKAAGAPKAVLQAKKLWVSELKARRAAIQCLKTMAGQPTLKADLLASKGESKLQELQAQHQDFRSVLASDPDYEPLEALIVKCLAALRTSG